MSVNLPFYFLVYILARYVVLEERSGGQQQGKFIGLAVIHWGTYCPNQTTYVVIWPTDANVSFSGDQ